MRIILYLGFQVRNHLTGSFDFPLQRHCLARGSFQPIQTTFCVTKKRDPNGQRRKCNAKRIEGDGVERIHGGLDHGDISAPDHRGEKKGGISAKTMRGARIHLTWAGRRGDGRGIPAWELGRSSTGISSGRTFSTTGLVRMLVILE